jgi:asparagine synthase (glutamine-hydrolysing)
VGQWAHKQAGQWSGVVVTKSGALLSSDMPRSFPLLYRYVAGTWLVSDDPQVLIDAAPTSWDATGRLQFRHAAYTLGTRTLLEGIYQLPAASSVELIDGDPTPHVHPWKALRYHQRITDEPTFRKLFTQALEQAVERVVKLTQGRRLAVPLSGGLDSRLILSLLKLAGASDVVAFTYGTAGSREAKISQQVAQSLDVPWYFVELSEAKVRQAWQAEGGAFIRNAWAGASLPHYQDWYALRELTSTGVLPAGTVILPGHTIVGNLHGQELLDPKTPMSRKDWVELLAHQHLNLQGQQDLVAALAPIRKPLLEAVDELLTVDTLDARQSLIEWFNVRERQAKYINHSMRAYEHFGLDWALPMLDLEVIEVWERGGLAFTDEERIWYKNLIAQIYARVSGTQPQLYAAGVNAIPAAPRRAAIKVLSTLRLDKAVSSLLTTRVQLRHPMAFQALLPAGSAATYAPQLFKGRSLNGIFADLFLADAWAADSNVFTEVI